MGTFIQAKTTTSVAKRSYQTGEKDIDGGIVSDCGGEKERKKKSPTRTAEIGKEGW